MALVDDPRPGLEGDHELWERVLRAAAGVSDGMNEPLGALNGLRCMGARLELREWETTEEGGRIEGHLQLKVVRGEIPERDYDQWRYTYLMPYKQEITKAFVRAGQVILAEKREAKDG